MSIGIIEVVFCFVMFSIIWFFIFKAKPKYDHKKLIKNLSSNIEKQENKVFLIQGKKVKVGSELKIPEIPELEQVKIEDIVKKPTKKIKKKVVKKATKKKK